jgi:predicted GIY-YIG superfamily endonuclease
MPMNYYVYILQSLLDGSSYIGYTKNIDQRLIRRWVDAPEHINNLRICRYVL